MQPTGVAMAQANGPTPGPKPFPFRTAYPVMVCALGDLTLLTSGRAEVLRADTKTAAFLGHLALRRASGASRDALLEMLWPAVDPEQATRSLHSLVYILRRTLAEALEGAPPVLRDSGSYRLNVEAGIGVDIALFDALVEEGTRAERENDRATAVETYRHAASVYRGELCLSVGTDIYATVERERLRASYLRVLALLADHAHDQGDYGASLIYALRLLAVDPCREDAHRLAMRCYLRQGERAQALRQYRVCEEALRVEFDAAPEPSTTALYDRIRLDPGGV